MEHETNIQRAKRESEADKGIYSLPTYPLGEALLDSDKVCHFDKCQDCKVLENHNRNSHKELLLYILLVVTILLPLKTKHLPSSRLILLNLEDLKHGHR